jgi:uncharacterized protein
MRIALIGATGFVGSRLLNEALHRGHLVTAVARHTESLQQNTYVMPVAADLNQLDTMEPSLSTHDVVILAIKNLSNDPDAIMGRMQHYQIKRLVVVGGAGSLRVSSELDLVDSVDFPAQFKPEAQAARAFLQRLRQEKQLNWTYASPAALLQAGQRTGVFRLGKDDLIRDDAGKSRISVEDFAVALLDEIESPQHFQQRFTVAY